MHTNSTAAFAREGRLTPELLDLGTEARQVWHAVTKEKSLRDRLMQTPLRHIIYRLRRASDRSDPLELIARILVTMAAVGYPEATVRLLITHLNDVVARCYTGNAHRTLDELDVEEMALEASENALSLERRITADLTAEQLLREAEVNEAEATLQLERAKELRRQARQKSRVLPFPSRVAVRPMGVR